MGVALLIDRAGLSHCLDARGIAQDDIAPSVVVAEATAFADLRRRFPGAAILSLAADPLAEAAALDAGASDAALIDAPDVLLAARIARLLAAAPPTSVEVGELTIDRLARAARRAGRALKLLPREYALLDQLAAHAGSTVSKAELHHRLCGLGFDPGTNILAVHVSRLRAVLDHGHAFPMLHTTRGVGYRLVAAPLAAG